jgi:hypothetical protein
MEGVTIRRDAPISLHPFTDFFQGFEKLDAVIGIFGPRTLETLRNLKVEFFSSRWGYMAVNDKDGHILVSAHYLQEGDERDIYLDVVHELVHVRVSRPADRDRGVSRGRRRGPPHRADGDGARRIPPGPLDGR